MEFSASVGFVHKEFVTMHSNTILKNCLNLLRTFMDARYLVAGLNLFVYSCEVNMPITWQN